MKKLAVLTAAILMCGACNSAQAGHMQEYEDSMKQMHHGMMIEYSDDADADFVRGMIPHHQGATNMAKIQLKYGTDPEIRKLAEAIIIAQEQEIALMKLWLEKRNKNK